MAGILGKELNVFTDVKEIKKVKANVQNYTNNREKIDVGIWHDYLCLNDETKNKIPYKIKLRLLKQFQQTWRFRPERQTIIPEFF